MSSFTTKCAHCGAVLRLKDKRYLGREIRCPRCSQSFTVTADSASTRPEKRPITRTERKKPRAAPSDTNAPEEAQGFVPVIRSEEQSPVARVRRGRRQRSLVPSILLFCGIIVAAGGAAWWANQQTTPTASPQTGVGNSAAPSAPVMRPAERGPDEEDSIASPVSGMPVSMDHIPVVPQLLLHLRPAALWTAAGEQRELAATLGDLGTWLHDFIVNRTRFQPQEIDELTIAVNFGARTGPPDIVVVARLAEEQRESQLLLERIRGTLFRELTEEVYESEDLAFIVIDPQTVVSSSRELAEDLADARQFPAVPLPDMEALIEKSDREHHVSLFLDLPAFDAHKDLVLVPQLRTLAEEAVLWVGTDCRMLSWTAHLEPHLFMQTSLVPAAELTPKVFHRRLDTRLDQLPTQLLTLVRGLQPQTTGRRKIVGRFPAMMQALVMGTQLTQQRTSVTLTTLLPAKAAPNLAAGATLTWNETARAPGERSESLSVKTSRASSLSVAERLRQTILVDFRRTPLHEALSFIAQEMQVQAVIDGDSLKIAGLTQNMAQTHSLGEVPAVQALDAILQQYEGIMVIVVDEKRRSILLTTQAAADQQGLTVFRTGADE